MERAAAGHTLARISLPVAQTDSQHRNIPAGLNCALGHTFLSAAVAADLHQQQPAATF
jgi:hypothetical protein